LNVLRWGHIPGTPKKYIFILAETLKLLYFFSFSYFKANQPETCRSYSHKWTFLISTVHEVIEL
jgi:hypothetical protein